MTLRQYACRASYCVLIIAAISFTITASLIGVLTFRRMHVDEAVYASRQMPWWLSMLDRHAVSWLFAELAVLAVATVAAIRLDTRQAAKG